MPARRARHPSQAALLAPFWTKKKGVWWHTPASWNSQQHEKCLDRIFLKEEFSSHWGLSALTVLKLWVELPSGWDVPEAVSKGFFSPTVTWSAAIKKGSGERPTDRCFLWRNIAARWEKPQTPFILILDVRDDALVLDIPQGPSDLQTQKNLRSRPDSLGRVSSQIKPPLKDTLSCTLRSGVPGQEQTGKKTLASYSSLPRGFCKAWRSHCQNCSKQLQPDLWALHLLAIESSNLFFHPGRTQMSSPKLPSISRLWFPITIKMK